MGAYINKACGRARGGVFSPNAGRWAIDRARGRYFARAFRAGVPKVEDFFAHKDNHSDYLRALRTKKVRRGLHISAIRGRYFIFIICIVCKTDTSFFVLFEQPLHYTAYILRLQVLTILAFASIARFFYTVSKPKNGVLPPRWDEPMHKNGQTADGHTGCRSAVWPLMDRSRRAVAAHCGGRHRNRAAARGGA